MSSFVSSGAQNMLTRRRPQVNSVAIELTAICNQRCDYCYNDWREDGGQAVGSPEESVLLQRVNKLLTELDVDHFTLTGGEPLVHKSFFAIAEAIRQAGKGFQMISNGTLVTPRAAARLAELNVRFVQVTLNGAEQELHEAHVGPGHFERTLAGVRHLVAAGVPVAGCIVVTKKNAAVVDQILALWESLGVRQVALSRFSPAGYAARHVAQLLPSQAELVDAFARANPFGERMLLQCTMPVPPCAIETEQYTNIRFGVCPIGTAQQEFALGPDGKLRNCTLHGEAIGGVDDILLHDDLAKLIRAPEVTQYRNTRPDFCEGCVHLDTCAGGCGAAAEWVLGARRKVDPLVAQYVDDDFSETLAVSYRNGRTHLELVM